jgi:transposase
MKKGSTAATIESRNFSVQQKLTIGLDLGDRNSWYCVLDEAGQIQAEQRVRTNAKTLHDSLPSHASRLSSHRIAALFCAA